MPICSLWVLGIKCRLYINLFSWRMKQNTVKGGTHLHIYEANKNNTTIKIFRSLQVFAIAKIGLLFFQVIFLSIFFFDRTDETVAWGLKIIWRHSDYVNSKNIHFKIKGIKSFLSLTSIVLSCYQLAKWRVPNFDCSSPQIYYKSLFNLHTELMGLIFATRKEYTLFETLWPKVVKFYPSYPSWLGMNLLRNTHLIHSWQYNISLVPCLCTKVKGI